MKVLQINTWYDFGSTGKLVKNLHLSYLKNGIDSYVIFGRGKKPDEHDKTRVFKCASNLEPKINSIFSRFSGLLYGGCFFSTKKVLKTIMRIKPDIIHLHCTNSFIINNFKLLRFIGKRNYKVVITLHAEYFYSGSCSHAFDCDQWKDGCYKCPNLKFATRSIFFDRTKKSWRLMNSAFNCLKKENRSIVAVSDWLKQRAALSKTFSQDKIQVIHNGIDTSVFHYIDVSQNKYSYLKENYSKIFLFVTPYFVLDKTDIKGCRDFLDIVQMCKDENNTLFILVCSKKTNFDFTKYKNLKVFTDVNEQTELAQIYSISDATLLLSKCETFSLVTIESISCGTPVIGYKCFGPESIAIPEQSRFFDQGKYIDVVNELKHCDYKKNLSGTTIYDNSAMVGKYISVYDGLVNYKKRSV